jgi:hypothetical protein
LRSLWCVPLVASLVATGCKIQQTPQEYIDHRTPTEQVRSGAEDELGTVIAAMSQALAGGDVESALQALPLAPDAYLVSGVGEGRVLEGGADIREALRSRLPAGDSRRVSDSRLTVGPRGTTAWFALRFEDQRTAGTAALTGVIVRGDESRWQLAHAHLSGVDGIDGVEPDTSATPPVPSP